MSLRSVQTIVDAARLHLLDASKVRWTDAELLTYFNQSVREIIIQNPTAYTTEVESEPLTVGSAIQTIVGATGTNDPQRLLDVPRNRGTSEGTPADIGPTIRKVNLDALKQYSRDWESDFPKTDDMFRCWAQHMTDPKRFYIWPPSNTDTGGTRCVDLWLSDVPTESLITDDPAPLNAQYDEALTNLIAYKALMKDADFTANVEKAAVFLKAYSALMAPFIARDKARGLL